MIARNFAVINVANRVRATAEVVMHWAKDVIRKFQSSLEHEAAARGRALRKSFTFTRPSNGWVRWSLRKLLILTFLALRGWVYLLALVFLVAYFMHDQEPTDLMQNWKMMRGMHD